ncbi:hypothetical protein [Effusibacillus consociatus]|uniref:Uncharacterized protein n=1 Tax=Effusibacillus consociatus TaxID=1117041 RepID=A0ABV9Q7I9_9BACL
MKLIMERINLIILIVGIAFLVKALLLFFGHVDGTGVTLNIPFVEATRISKEEIPSYATNFAWLGVLLLAIPLISVLVKRSLKPRNQVGQPPK